MALTGMVALVGFQSRDAHQGGDPAFAHATAGKPSQ
jgi:hypothetical protein